MLFMEVRNILSICTVSESSYNDALMLIRRADINGNGEIVEPLILEDEPKIFGNRTTLYKKDGPSIEGFIGVWRWSAIHNENDYDKDYVTSQFEPSIVPVEFVELIDASSSSDVVEKIKNGIPMNKPEGDLFVGRKVDSNYYEVIYLQKQNIEELGDIITVSADTIKIPFYRIHKDEIVSIDGVQYFKKINVDMVVQGFYNIKTPMEVVQDVILSKISWQTMKMQGYSRDQYKKIKDYIESIDVEPLTKKIQERLDCSEAKAKSLIEDFKNSGDSYLVGHSYVDGILESLVERNEELSAKYESLVEQKWNESNTEHIKKADAILKSMKDEIVGLEVEIKLLNSEIKNKMDELALIDEETKKQATLGDDVKQVIYNKIEEAKKDLAGFIGDVEWVRLIGSSPSVASSKNPNDSIVRFKPGAEILNEGDQCSSWKDVLETLAYELAGAGVAKEHQKNISALLYSCYINNFPVLLAGPSAYEIACAFSAAIDHKLPCTVECRDGMKMVENSVFDTKVVAIRYPFAQGLREDIHETIKDNNHFFMLCHPYSDDLLIEPVGLYSYMFPIITDYFVDKRPESNFVGGVKTKGFTELKMSGNFSHRYQKAFRKLGIGAYTSNICDKLVDDCRTMGVANDDFMYRYCILSLAHVTGNLDIANEIVQNSRVSDELKSFFSGFVGE